MKLSNLLLVFLFFCSCKTINEEVGIDKEMELKMPLATEDSFYSKIKKYLPDTSANPLTSIEFKKAVKPFQKEFSSFISNTFDNKVVLSINEQEQRNYAVRLFDDYQHYIAFKFARNAKDLGEAVTMLGFCSPYSALTSIADRKELFLKFPKSVQESIEGKKTWSRLQEYSYNNIGKDFSQVSEVVVIGETGKSINLLDSINKTGKTLILFGASWCGPCILDEKSLRDHTGDYDTRDLKIIGLSIDKNSKQWFDYVQKESLPWVTYILPGDTENALIKFLNFQGVPRTILIDENKKILKEHTSYTGILNKLQ